MKDKIASKELTSEENIKEMESFFGSLSSDMTMDEIKNERLVRKHGSPLEQIHLFLEKATDKELEQLADYIKETFWR